MKPLLSICIPTYNRSQFLGVSLAALIEQSRNFLGEIEIIISDNASMDDTGVIVEGFHEVFSDLKYFRNQENFGYDRNLDNAIRHSSGKYCWILSDDELVLEGTISFIIDLLRKYSDITYICLDVAGNNPKNLPNTEIIEVNNGNTLLERYGLVGGLISQNIIRREFYPKDVSKYYGNHWIHLSVIFEIIQETPLLLVNKTLLRGQREVCTWAEGGKVLLTFSSLKTIIFSWKDLNYNKEVINSIMNNLIKSLPMTMFSAKIHGLQKSKENLKILKETFSTYGIYYYIAWIIYETPSILFLFLRKFLGR